jgi:hypothetical protein
MRLDLSGENLFKEKKIGLSYPVLKFLIKNKRSVNFFFE